MSDSHTHTQRNPDDFDLTDVPDVNAEVIPHAMLVVASGPNAGRGFDLFAREVTIGRSPKAHVRIDERGVSGEHARLTLVEGKYVLVDLGSTNGTFLNGTKLSPGQNAILNPGDSIQVAESVLTYTAGKEGRTIEPTHQISRFAPMIQDPTLMKLPEAQILSQLLSIPSGPPQKAPATLEEQIAKIANLMQIIRRHGALLFAAVAMCALIADASVFLSPPVSKAIFQLRISPPKSKDPLKEGYTQEYDLDLFYATTEQNFLSPGLVSSSLKALEGKEPPRGNVAGAIGNMKFEAIGEALYRGTYSNRDPDRAVKFLKKHLQVFVASEIQRSVHVAQAEADFLSERLKETDAELARTELALKEFKGKHLEGLPENATGHLASREQLMTRRAELGAQLERTRLELDLARKQLKEEAPLAVKKGEGSDVIERQLADVKRQLSEARSKGLGEAHPQVEALKRQVTDLERMAAEARSKSSSDFDRSANPGLLALKNRVGELEVAYKGTQAELGSIGGLVTRLDTIVGTMPEVEARYAELTRSYTATKDLHAKLFDRLRTIQLQLELERASAAARYEVIAPPETSGLALRQALIMKTLIGLVAGLIIGGLIITVLELRRILRERRNKSFAIVPVR